MRDYVFIPYAFSFFFFFFILIFSLFFLFMFGIPLAFYKLGIPPFIAYLLLFLSLIGSAVNIPIREMEGKEIEYAEISFWGIRYRIPYVRKTVIAINFGGAIIPIAISSYEILRVASAGNVSLLMKIFLAVFISSIIFHFFAKPVKGIGVAMPALIPPIISAILGISLGDNPAIIAYISGTIGTLIGADLLNLHKIKGFGGIASIGGAGTFDGIFLSGIIAVLLV